MEKYPITQPRKMLNIRPAGLVVCVAAYEKKDTVKRRKIAPIAWFQMTRAGRTTSGTTVFANVRA